MIWIASLRWIFSRACTRSIKVVFGNWSASHWMTSFVGLFLTVDSPWNSRSTSLGTSSLQARCDQFLTPGTSSRLSSTAIVCKSSEPGVMTYLINDSSVTKQNIWQSCHPKLTFMTFFQYFGTVTLFFNILVSCRQKQLKTLCSQNQPWDGTLRRHHLDLSAEYTPSYIWKQIIEQQRNDRLF